jgi:hypothetical protein
MVRLPHVDSILSLPGAYFKANGGTRTPHGTHSEIESPWTVISGTAPLIGRYVTFADVKRPSVQFRSTGDRNLGSVRALLWFRALQGEVS